MLRRSIEGWLEGPPLVPEPYYALFHTPYDKGASSSNALPLPALVSRLTFVKRNRRRDYSLRLIRILRNDFPPTLLINV